MKTAWKFPNRRRLTYCVPTNCRIEGWSSARKAFCPWLHEIYLYFVTCTQLSTSFLSNRQENLLGDDMNLRIILLARETIHWNQIIQSQFISREAKPSMRHVLHCNTCICSIWKNCALFQNTPFQAICFDILIGIHHCERVCLYLCARAHCEMLKLLTKNPSDLYMWYDDNHCDCKLLITDLFF